MRKAVKPMLYGCTQLGCSTAGGYAGSTYVKRGR
jgi:hypothetical protein